MADLAQGMGRIAKGARGIRWLRFLGPRAALAADPGGAQPLVIHPLKEHGIAVGTEQVALGIITPEPTRGLVLVAGVLANGDHGDHVGLVHRGQAGPIAHPGVGDHFADWQRREALLQMGKIAGQDFPLVRRRGLDRRGRGPGHMEFIVADHLGVTAVAVDIAGRFRLFALLVAATVVDQPGRGIARGGVLTAVGTGRLGAGAPGEPLSLGGTGARRFGEGAIARIGHLPAAHGRVGFVQHPIGGQGQTLFRGAIREGRMGR
jgi:hypothetical protein